MPLKYSTLTTGKPEDFFDGSQPLRFTSDSAPLTCPSGPYFSFAGGMTSIGWTTVSGETVGSHMFTFPAQKTQGTTLLPNPELLARMFCHFVVSALPNEALPELVDE